MENKLGMEKQWNLTNVSSFFCLFYIIKGVGTEATYDNNSENVFDDKFNSSAQALNISSEHFAIVVCKTTHVHAQNLSLWV